jgi:hypothetical protein
MPLLSELSDFIDPTAEAEQDLEAFGENTRAKFGVNEEVGRRAIQKVQPDLEGYTPGGFFSNLAGNVGELASGMFTAATYPIRHPSETLTALEHPIDTAEKIGSAVAQGYKESYTPHPDESIPSMILRRLYEKPVDTLMDASALGQIAFGGAGLAARATTAGVRGAVEGGEAGAALVRAAAGTVGELPAEGVAVARRAASASRAIDLFDALQERAKLLDPLTIAQQTGTAALKTFAPDTLAALRATKRMTDDIAERTAIKQSNEAMMQKQVDEAFGDLNPAERMVIHPYIAGRLNFDRPMGEQLMSHTGEWVPVKGDTIRPDALEAARQKYVPIQQQIERLRGLAPDQVAATAGQKAMGDAQEFLGEHFDPLHPEVQQHVVDSVASALKDNDEYLKRRATGEMRTSLDLAKERDWRKQVDDMTATNVYRSARDAEASFPRPEPVTPEEALRAMGPQGGMYFPHSAEAYTRDQSTIKNILTKLGEASTFKENTYALYRSGVMENQDPVKQLMRAYATFNQGKSWVQMAYDAAEQGVKEGNVTRMKRGWGWETDPDVIKGTHQPFHPGMMMTHDLVEEDGQHLMTRLLEVAESDRVPSSEATIEATTVPNAASAKGPYAAGGMPAGVTIGNLNFSDIMRGLVEKAESGPIYRYKKEIPLYKVPTPMGHAFASVRESLQPSTNPIVRLMDNATQWWNWTNLNLKLTRMVNNIVGNTAFAAMQGVHPFTPRGLQSLVGMGKAIGYKAGLTSSAEAERLAKVFDLPGIRGGGFQVGLEQATGTVGQRAMESGFAPLRGIGKWGAMLAKANSNIESAYRAASLFYELSPNAIDRAKRMFSHGIDSMSLGEKVDQFTKAGAVASMDMPEYRNALKAVNRYFHDYNRTTPFERQMTRRIFPYYKFFKHSTELITRYPFEHPFKAAVGRTLGKAAMQDVKDQMQQWGLDWDRDVPPAQRDSLPIWHSVDKETGQPTVWMYNTKGPNPFSQTTGYLAEQALQMLNPVIRVAIERATGVNLFTRERYRGAISSFTGREVDPKNGQIVDSFHHPTFGEAFLRSFWPYQTVRELVAQGRVPTDTASLLEMARNGPGAWVYDKRGFPLRKPTTHPLAPLGRFVGFSPSAVQPPTKEQRTARKQVVSDQLHTLWQRYPERREEIQRAMEESAQEVIDKYADQ